MNLLTKSLKSHIFKAAFKAERQQEFRTHYLVAGGLPDAHDKHLPSHFQVCPWHLSYFLPLALSAAFPFHLKISISGNIQIQNCQAEQNGEESLFPCRKEDTQSGQSWKLKVNTRSQEIQVNYQGTSRTPDNQGRQNWLWWNCSTYTLRQQHWTQIIIMAHVETPALSHTIKSFCLILNCL